MATLVAGRSPLFWTQVKGGLASIVDVSKFSGNVFYVDSNASGGGDTTGHGYHPDKPFLTIDYAIGRCTANQGDVILVLPGHAETLSTAAAIAADVAGVTVYGLGMGAAKPTLTFSAVDATIVLSAASFRMLGFRVVPSIDSVVSPFVVQAADCELDYEILETDNLIEFVRSLLSTAAGDRLKANIKHIGRTGGDACVNEVRLVGCDGADIYVDFYGKASTAIVEFHTTACTNIKVNGRVYNSGTTDGSKNVVDTVTGSTWDAVIWDATAGLAFSGSSGKALASIDLKTITDALYGTVGIATFPASAVPGNNVSLAEVLRDLWDAIRNGTGGSEPGANKSVIDAIGADGAALLTVGAGSLVGASGSQFIVKKSLVSSTVVQAGVDVTGLATGGDILIEDVIFQSDGIGLVTGTNFELKKDGGNGVLTVFSETIAAIGGANKSESLGTGSVVAGDAFVLNSGQKLTANSTVADCTGAGVLDVYLICRRVAAGATLAAA